MNAKIIKIETKKGKQKIKVASKIIVSGGLVAFPTETVYGLGANVFDSKAVKKIFVAKGRPQDNPLIVHISNISQIKKIAKDFPEKAKALTKKFWPGPLTIVLKKKIIIPDIVTAGLDSVAVRMPSNKIALELIRQAKVPIVAPSANLSGKPSPTTAKHVIDDLSGKVDCIIDNGNCKIGIESTVIDFSSKTPIILRPGYITKDEIEEIIGKVKEAKSRKSKTPKAPGMKYKHYSPKAKVILIDYRQDFEKEIHKIKIQNPNKKIKIINFKNPEEYAKKLFFKFREFDKKGTDIIIAKGLKEDKLGTAVMNRLKKASTVFIK